MVKRSVYRIQVKERFQQLGIWRDFVELRDRYVTLGLTPAQAFQAAVTEVEKKFPEGKAAKPPPTQRPIMEEIGDQDTVRRLIRAAKGRKASPLQEFTWVYTHAGIEWSDIPPDDVPSPGAVYHLSKVKASDRDYQKFLTDYAKLLPPKSQLDAEHRQSDDGRRVFSLIDALEEELSKGEKDESPVPAVGGPAG